MEKSATYIDQIPDLAVEIVSPSNLGRKCENNLAFYRQLAFPEFWLVQLDGSIEIWRSAEPKMNAVCKPGELLSSALFPGMVIDPAWLMVWSLRGSKKACTNRSGSAVGCYSDYAAAAVNDFHGDGLIAGM
jgi:Uma2 family endonuclease